MGCDIKLLIMGVIWFMVGFYCGKSMNQPGVKNNDASCSDR